MSRAPSLPPRYAPVQRLGKGGGGEVWSVRDVVDGAIYALKALSDDATEREVLALVREASLLSGLEGLGVPRVMRFGRLRAGTAYMVRELVEGQSLADGLAGDLPFDTALSAFVRATDQLTRLHRSSLLHGDVKPANIIVGPGGTATLVDLGLSSPWREKGGPPLGLTPGYAAPELFAGEPLTVRAEVYSLGATLREILEEREASIEPAQKRGLEAVVERAIAEHPSDRWPSVDELASAVRSAVRLPSSDPIGMADAAWPIVDLDGTLSRILTAVASMPAGYAIRLEGRSGSGRTAVLRRLAWSLGVEGRAVAWIEAERPNAARAVVAELEGCAGQAGVVVLVDDLELLAEADVKAILAARAKGAKLVVTDANDAATRVLGKIEGFELPPLEKGAAAGLVRRAIPSLADNLVADVVSRADGRPGRLRAIVRRLDGEAVVTVADVDRVLGARGSMVPPSGDDVAAASQLLDQGRMKEAAAVVDRLSAVHSAAAGVVRARLFLGRGDTEGALRELDDVRGAAEKEPKDTWRTWSLVRARVLVRKGAYGEAAQLTNAALVAGGDGDATAADLLACRGVAESFLGQHEDALATLSRSVEVSRLARDRRVEALALGSYAIALQRTDRLADAKRAYEQALEAAEEVGDAGAVAQFRLNLAVLAIQQGEIAPALSHLEATIDMGRRAGRAGTVQQALLNLANLDLYLGRIARASASIDALAGERDELGSGQKAQLLGLEAELAGRAGDVTRASTLYETCAAAYEALSRNVDAAEARIEAVLVAARAAGAEPTSLAATLERAAATLGSAPTHRAALLLARGAVAALARDEARARQAFGEALASSREAGQKEWVWRSLDNRSRLEIDCGRPLAARRDAEEALAVLEDIAARLPRDLREVYWNDARRRSIRAAVAGESRHGVEATLHARNEPSGMIGAVTRFLEEDRLSRILEINRELATLRDLGPLLERVINHAASFVGAERGYVLLLDETGELTVHAARERGGDETHRTFSKGVAARAIDSGEPLVSVSAKDDARIKNNKSVHELSLQSIACVPIRSPGGSAIGALYLETRTRSGALFERELPTLTAFADQAAVAIENARLLAENARRAAALEDANEELAAAQERLRELLDAKKAQLEVTRKDLKDTRAALKSRFGYHGLVGTSAAMRRTYDIIERVKSTDVPVVIAGESGTGKEMVARAIHDAGARGKRPFTGVNCGAIPENLLESELFGHVRGAFTGADRDRLGLFRDTDGGTILLDEIGEMPAKMQAGLLRVLQEKVVRPVGGTREEPIDVRVIAASHRDLSQMIAAGTFREDLYYRLRVVELRVPALRERPEDIPALIDHFLGIFAARYRRDKGSVSREALRALSGYSWPGNVRQLQNALLNAWVLADKPELEIPDFDLPLGSRRISETHAPPPSSGSLPSSRERSETRPSSGRKTSLADHRAQEKSRILQALEESSWNRVRAAQILDMPRRTFYRRLKEYDIQ